MFVRIRGSLGLWRVRKCLAMSFWVDIFGCRGVGDDDDVVVFQLRCRLDLVKSDLEFVWLS